MQPFVYTRADDVADALRRERDHGERAAYLAGGTTLLDLMKLGTLAPSAVIDINGLSAEHGAIAVEDERLVLGALVRMAEAARHPELGRRVPMVAEALLLAASPQLRNMATLGGNLLQRTRCSYFRDPSHAACNKRAPGSGCAAREGISRKHAVLGTSEQCIATYPGDLAQALVALDAEVELTSATGVRRLPVEQVHRLPGATPERETTLEPGELITRLFVPTPPFARRSRYVKVRDRASYEFALASAAVALDLDGERVRSARIALGGVATKPWRAREAEAYLVGHTLDEASALEAAKLAFRTAETHGANDYKPELGRRTLVRALLEVRALEV